MAQAVDFISQVPTDILTKTEIHKCNYVTLFRPLVYMGGIHFDVTDYHIVIPSECTPDLLINNKMIHGEQRKILTVNPGDAVSCLINAPAKPYYSILIKAGLLHKISEEIGFSGEVRFESILNPYSDELLQAIMNFKRESDRPDCLNLMLESLEIQIATMLLREFKTNIKKAVPLSDMLPL